VKKEGKSLIQNGKKKYEDEEDEETRREDKGGEEWMAYVKIDYCLYERMFFRRCPLCE
jgi:hypothetical protein